MIKEAIRRTEAAFENSGYWIHDHPKRVILMMLLIVVFLAFQLPSIKFDTSTESFFEKDDPTLLEYDAFREQFGRDEIVLALIHPKDVFKITLLEKLKAFHQELEETVPHLDEVRSLVNVTSMRGEEGELIIEELMEDWPDRILCSASNMLESAMHLLASKSHAEATRILTPSWKTLPTMPMNMLSNRPSTTARISGTRPSI